MAPMTKHVFDRLTESCAKLAPVPAAVVWPLSDYALEGAVKAADAGLLAPRLIGPRRQLERLAAQEGIELSRFALMEAENEAHAAILGVELCRRGECEILMKGSLHTDSFLHPVVSERTGLRTDRRLSHVFVLNLPSYPRILFLTDAAINIYPTLLDKKDIVQNAIDLAHLLEIPEPRVALLSAVETVTPKITSTIDAAALCKMAERGQLSGGIVDGPLAFDNAVDAEAAAVKGIRSEVAGRADILVVPDLESGNMLAKQLEYLAGAEAAGIVLGARVPIVLTSRADRPRSRLASAAIAVRMAHGRRRGERAAVPA